MMDLKIILLIYILLINIIGIIIMFIDKKRAIKNSDMRIPEKTLFLISLFLGAFGIYIGMYKYRHKTKHTKFKIGVPILLILNLICIYIIFKAL